MIKLIDENTGNDVWIKPELIACVRPVFNKTKIMFGSSEILVRDSVNDVMKMLREEKYPEAKMVKKS